MRTLDKLTVEICDDKGKRLCPTLDGKKHDFFEEYMTINVSVCSIFLGGNLGENEVIYKPPFRLIMDILRFYIWSSKLEKSPSRYI